KSAKIVFHMWRDDGGVKAINDERGEGLPFQNQARAGVCSGLGALDGAQLRSDLKAECDSVAEGVGRHIRGNGAEVLLQTLGVVQEGARLGVQPRELKGKRQIDRDLFLLAETAGEIEGLHVGERGNRGDGRSLFIILLGVELEVVWYSRGPKRFGKRIEVDG